MTLTIASDGLSAEVGLQGGTLLAVEWRGMALLRPRQPGAGDDPLKAASFPLVPFCNRVEGNCYRFEGREVRLAANTAWDPLHLHGDGWLGAWTLEERTANEVRLSFDHDRGPLAYRAEQRIGVAGGVLRLDLAVTNRGARQPFGLGHHPYFPLTPDARLRAGAAAMWSEKAGFLPDRLGPVPEDLDFGAPRGLPERWIDNAFEGWDGTADILWPSRGLALSIRAEPPFSRYFLFRSDEGFEPGFRGDYFAFEPMTHSPNGQNLDGLGGLVVLDEGQALSTTVTFTPQSL